MYPNCHRITSQKNVYTRQGIALVSTIKNIPSPEGAQHPEFRPFRA